jgi:hypothetical protein
MGFSIKVSCRNKCIANTTISFLISVGKTMEVLHSFKDFAIVD